MVENWQSPVSCCLGRFAPWWQERCVWVVEQKNAQTIAGSCEGGAALAQVEGSFLGMSEAIDRQPWQPRIITRGSTNNLQYNGPIMANTTNHVIQDPVEITQEFMEYPSLRIVPKGNESSKHHRFSGPMLVWMQHFFCGSRVQEINFSWNFITHRSSRYVVLGGCFFGGKKPTRRTGPSWQPGPSKLEAWTNQPTNDPQRTGNPGNKGLLQL